jgi:hypothetical protein
MIFTEPRAKILSSFDTSFEIDKQSVSIVCFKVVYAVRSRSPYVKICDINNDCFHHISMTHQSTAWIKGIPLLVSGEGSGARS